MREMKDSGIEWIGDIPKNWIVMPIKYYFSVGRGRVISVNDLHDDGKYPVYSSQTENNGCFGYLRTYDFSGPAITWTTDGAKAGTVFFRDGKYNCTNVCGILKIKNQYKQTSDLHFLTYAISVVAFANKRYDINGFKIMNNEMANIRYAIPPYEEQQKIATFLDKKCTEIDALTKDIEKQIENLQQYKKSVITESVTKGLDPNVEMKSTDNKWFSKIPTSWSLKPIKYLFDIVSGSTPLSTESSFWDGDVKWVTPADFKTEDMYVSEGKRNITTAGYRSCSTSILPKDSIIFTKRAPIGTVATSSEELCTNQGCLGLIPKNSEVDTKFFYFVFSVFQEFFELYGSGTTFKEISASVFSNLRFVCPSIKEQKSIAEHLDDVCLRINSVIKSKQQQLTTLADYKKSLIFEYVTGKKEV